MKARNVFQDMEIKATKSDELRAGSYEPAEMDLDTGLVLPASVSSSNITPFMGWATVLLALLYFVTAQPIVGSDSAAGNNLALTTALANNHSFAIDHFVGFVARNAQSVGFANNIADYPNLSYFQGHYYSDQPPGTSLLALPFYQSGHLLALLFGIVLPATLAGSKVTLAYPLLACALAGAVTVLLVYAAARKLGSSQASARYAALALGLGSALWGAAGRFMPPIFSLGLLSLALLLALPPLPRELANFRMPTKLVLSWGSGTLLGLALGFAVTVDYGNLVWTPIFVLYLIVAGRVNYKQTSSIGGPLGGWLLGILPLAVYNSLIFGRPWAFTYGFEFGDTSATSLLTRYFGGFSWTDLPSVFFGGGRGMLGPFLLFFGVWGLIALFGQRGKRKEAVLFAALLTVSLGLGLMRHSVGDDNGRAGFMLAALSPLALATAVWHERFQFLTRLEQRWVPYLATIGLALYYFISRPGPGPANLEAIVYLLPLVPVAGLGVVVWQLMARSAPNRRLATIGLSLAALMVLLTALLGTNTSAQAVTNARYGNNLLYNPQLIADAKTTNVEGWQIYGNATPLTPHGLTLTGAMTLKPFLVGVQGGKSYNLSLTAKGLPSAGLEVEWAWSDEGHLPMQAWKQDYVLRDNQTIHDSRAAPPAAAYLQLTFYQTNGKTSYSDFALTDDSVRIEPMQNFATAALSFSFDWESAMGGLIHSQGGSSFLETGEVGSLNINEGNQSKAFDYATGRGLAMRQGADNLLSFFQKYNLQGTFYATGYNLLDGNPARTNFVNGTDPIYKNADIAHNWASDYWLTHPWYSFDPYTTYKDPIGKAWYFGDQTRALASAAQDIEPHTFGHLYVRGVTVQEFAADMQTWLKAARALKLPAPTTFAFPWKASNSVTVPFYQFLADNGFVAVTRLYDEQQYIKEDYAKGTLSFPDAQRQLHATPTPDNYYYYLDRVHSNNQVLEPRLLVLHDYELRDDPSSEQTARILINQLLERRGYGSIWTHPEEVVQPNQMQQWERTIAYAASLRSEGLWVATVKNIIQQRLDVQKISLQNEATSDPHTLILTITNHTDHRVLYSTYTVPSVIQDIQVLVGSDPHLTKHGSQFVIDQLNPDQAVTIAIQLTADS